MKITFRLEEGWSAPAVVRDGTTKCPICEAKLFVAPHGGVYCESVHTFEISEPVETGMSEQAKANRDAIESIRHRMNAGALTYEEAQAEAEPVIKAMNEGLERMAKEHGQKHKPLTFRYLMR